ncbi:CaiB/BaiF CoA transferase family protein [Variovorax sp. ZT4R33]|uniref:CaiB/BaiF CoA transferase family protein n=1 Tax=Variovorax sp. ZT4R33 TaxID=3443743 RepID=UPI003F4683D5
MSLPLSNIRVIEFSHMVMGPTCGMILGDLGADVIKIEPPGGDKTRQLPGLGMGFFRTFNRNKRSVVLDLDIADDKQTALDLIGSADVVIENFRPGRMAGLGLDYETLSARFPNLIYVSHKGFLRGPYQERLALDEVVQMMGGLAYMTGPVGRPLRAGSSVNDIMGGMFGALGVIAALYEQKAHGARGQEIQSALFENCAFLSAQHMQQFHMSGEPPPPVPSRKAAWGIYDVFTVADGEQLFIGAVGQGQWVELCKVIGREELLTDARFETNARRVENRTALLQTVGDSVLSWNIDQLSQRLEQAKVPFAPIRRPDQLVSDPHLLQSGGMVPITTEDGGESLSVLLPFTMGGRRPGVRRAIPKIGEHTAEVLSELKQRST